MPVHREIRITKHGREIVNRSLPSNRARIRIRTRQKLFQKKLSTIVVSPIVIGNDGWKSRSRRRDRRATFDWLGRSSSSHARHTVSLAANRSRRGRPSLVALHYAQHHRCSEPYAASCHRYLSPRDKRHLPFPPSTDDSDIILFTLELRIVPHKSADDPIYSPRILLGLESPSPSPPPPLIRRRYQARGDREITSGRKVETSKTWRRG